MNAREQRALRREELNSLRQKATKGERACMALRVVNEEGPEGFGVVPKTLYLNRYDCGHTTMADQETFDIRVPENYSVAVLKVDVHEGICPQCEMQIGMAEAMVERVHRARGWATAR